MSAGQSSYRLLLPERQRRLEGTAHLLAVGTRGTASLHPPACGEDLAMPGPPTPQCDHGLQKRRWQDSQNWGGYSLKQLSGQLVLRRFSMLPGECWSPVLLGPLDWDAGPSAGGFSPSKLHTPPSGLAFMSTATPPWKCLVSEDKQGRTWLVLGWEDCVHNSCHLFSRALCSCAFTKSSLFLYCHLNGIKTSVFSSIFSWKLGFTHKIIDLANGFSNRI